MKKIWKWVKSGFTKTEQKPQFIKEKIFQEKEPEPSRQKMIVFFVKEAPVNAKKNTVYIVGENNFYWMVGLLCPCECGNFIHLNLLKEAKPRWKFKISKGLISISPSVRRTSGCKSHFFIRKGKCVWAEDY